MCVDFFHPRTWNVGPGSDVSSRLVLRSHSFSIYVDSAGYSGEARLKEKRRVSHPFMIQFKSKEPLLVSIRNSCKRKFTGARFFDS